MIPLLIQVWVCPEPIHPQSYCPEVPGVYIQGPYDFASLEDCGVYAQVLVGRLRARAGWHDLVRMAWCSSGE